LEKCDYDVDWVSHILLSQNENASPKAHKRKNVPNSPIRRVPIPQSYAAALKSGMEPKWKRKKPQNTIPASNISYSPPQNSPNVERRDYGEERTGKKKRRANSKPYGQRRQQPEDPFITVPSKKKIKKKKPRRVMKRRSFHSLSREGKQLFHIRAALFKKAAQAYKAGDGKTAKELSLRAREVEKQMKEAHRESGMARVRERGSGGRETIDLHF